MVPSDEAVLRGRDDNIASVGCIAPARRSIISPMMPAILALSRGDRGQRCGMFFRRVAQCTP